jgi:hypothetical protein
MADRVLPCLAQPRGIADDQVESAAATRMLSARYREPERAPGPSWLDNTPAFLDMETALKYSDEGHKQPAPVTMDRGVLAACPGLAVTPIPRPSAGDGHLRHGAQCLPAGQICLGLRIVSPAKLGSEVFASALPALLSRECEARRNRVRPGREIAGMA